MKSKIAILLILLMSVSSVSACSFKAGNVQAVSNSAENENPVKNAAVEESVKQTGNKTGIYYYKSGGRLNIFKIQETGTGNLRAAFNGIYEYKQDGEWIQHAGGTGVITAKFNGEEALLKLEDDPDCQISLKFRDNKLIVRQHEDCSFAGKVIADGVYVKLKNAAPDFKSREFYLEEYDKLPDTTFNAGQIRFPKGTFQTTVSGEITETQKEIAYIINARKGQTLDVAILVGGANVDLGAYIIAPDGLNLMGKDVLGLGWSGKLPASGNYKIVVFANETESFKYKMRVSIK